MSSWSGSKRTHSDGAAHAHAITCAPTSIATSFRQNHWREGSFPCCSDGLRAPDLRHGLHNVPKTWVTLRAERIFESFEHPRLRIAESGPPDLAFWNGVEISVAFETSQPPNTNQHTYPHKLSAMNLGHS